MSVTSAPGATGSPEVSALLAVAALGVLRAVFRPFRVGVWTSSLGGSSVDLRICAGTSIADRRAPQTDLLCGAIREHFDAAGTSMPFPLREWTMIHGTVLSLGRR